MGITIQNEGNIIRLGSILLYKQENAYRIFLENKERFALKNNMQITKSQFSPLSNFFPWIVEGFYEYTERASFQQFSAYTNKGDYIIFMLYEKDPNVDLTNQLGNRFIRFINIVSKELGYQ